MAPASCACSNRFLELGHYDGVCLAPAVHVLVQGPLHSPCFSNMLRAGQNHCAGPAITKDGNMRSVLVLVLSTIAGLFGAMFTGPDLFAFSSGNTACERLGCKLTVEIDSLCPSTHTVTTSPGASNGLCTCDTLFGECDVDEEDDDCWAIHTVGVSASLAGWSAREVGQGGQCANGPGGVVSLTFITSEKCGDLGATQSVNIVNKPCGQQPAPGAPPPCTDIIRTGCTKCDLSCEEGS